MSKYQVIEGDMVVRPGVKFCLVVARFNSFITERLVEGAIDTLKRHGCNEENITLVRAPGAFELPLVTQRVLQKQEFHAVIALGAVIRGGTPHFEYVSGECTKGISIASMHANIPVSFGVLTVDSIEQAIERAGTKAGNKGAEAAASAIEMVNLISNLS